MHHTCTCSHNLEAIAAKLVISYDIATKSSPQLPRKQVDSRSISSFRPSSIIVPSQKTSQFEGIYLEYARIISFHPPFDATFCLWFKNLFRAYCLWLDGKPFIYKLYLLYTLPCISRSQFYQTASYHSHTILRERLKDIFTTNISPWLSYVMTYAS